MMANSYITPIQGIKVPRSEMQSLTILMRGMNLVARTTAENPEKAILCGDSKCSIAAHGETSGALGPYFANSLSEVHKNM